MLFEFMKGNICLYAGAVICMGLSTVLLLAGPLITRTIIDSIIGDKPMDVPSWALHLIEYFGGRDVLSNNLWVCGLALVAITLTGGVFQFLKGKWSAEASESTVMRIKNTLYDHIQKLPYDYHIKAEAGELIQRCTSDVETVRKFLAVQFVEIGHVVFMITAALYFMVGLDIRMTVVSMALIPVIVCSAVIFFTRVQNAFRMSDEAESSMSQALQENLAGIRVVRAFGRQAVEVEKFDKRNRSYTDLTYRLIILLAYYWSLSDLLVMVQAGMVLVLGVYWVASGVITLGTLVVFISYEGMLLWPVRQMGRIIADSGKTLVSLERIDEILRISVEDMDEEGLKPEICGDIEFKNVSFWYDEGRKVLDDISFKVRKGQTAAILGPTGCGKSSVVNLLQRLYDYQEGSISLDGVELKEINKRWLRKHVGIILQEPFLFSRTVKENIGFAKHKAEDIEIYEAARAACVHDVILKFENGYDTLVGERGVTLSGGQKQRTAVARTLLLECPVLIFDDSLSAVDTETDKHIRRKLKSKNRNTTTFIIAHRITTLAEADIILVLDHGRMVQWGTHEELVCREGLYKRIWDIQNSLEQELEEVKREDIKEDRYELA